MHSHLCDRVVAHEVLLRLLREAGVDVPSVAEVGGGLGGGQ